MMKKTNYLLSFLTLLVVVAALFGGDALAQRASQTARAASQPAGDLPNNGQGEPIYPGTVNLADLPAGVSDPALQGQNKAINDPSRVSQATLAAMKAEALLLEPSLGVQIAESGPGLEAPVPGVSFDSMDITECCGGGSNVPPDPDMAAGPNHLVAVVNVALEIYDKSGTSLAGPTTLASFFAPLGGDCTLLFDPNTLYDEEADRWIVSADGNGTTYCIGVSQTSDPTAAYFLYAVPAQPLGGEFHDYPHTGVGDSYIVVGANQFNGGIPGGFEGRVWALDKAAMYAGGALAPITASTGGTEGTPQPLHLHGFNQGTWPAYGATHYFVTDPYDGCTLNVWRWNIPAAPSIVSTINLCAATSVTGGLPVNWPQLGGSTIDANDWRMRGFEYRNGSGWVADSISCNPGGGTVDCVRWDEIDLTASPPTLVQAGVYASSSQYRTFPDLAVNRCGDMAIGYSKGTSTSYPSIWYTGRENGDPPGTLQAEALLKAGEVTYTAFDPAPYRWGDYTGMTIDPDGLTFWYLGEYSKNITAPAKWGTYIGSFAYPSCTGGGTNPSISLNKTVGTDPNVCAATDAITVTTGTDVTYCYEVTNDGDVTFNYHDLVDTELGTILSNFNYSLALSATVFLTETTTIQTSTVNTATWSARGVSAYAVDDAIAYNFEDISGTGTAFVLGDNQVSAALPIGFPFGFYDIDYTDIYASSNGFLTVLAGQSSGCCTGQVIPTAGDPDGIIAGWWEDLNPSQAGAGLYYETLGSAPNRYLIVQFTNVQHFPNGNPVTFQYKLFEGSNTIEIHYLDAPSDGGTHSVGVENETGTLGLLYSRGTTSLTTPLAVQFTPVVREAMASDSATVTLLPDIAVAPASLSGVQPVDAQVTHPLTISNPGGSNLDWSVFEDAGPAIFAAPTGATTSRSAFTCAALSDIPWASVDPITGTTPAGLSTVLDVNFDSTGLSTGVYTGTLCIDSNAATNPLVAIPLTMTVAAYGVELSPAQAQTGRIGTTVNYVVQITNTGDIADVFDLSASGNTWGTTLAMGSIALNPGETGSFTVMVDVPAGAVNNATDSATITADSQGDGAVSGTTTLTTTAQQYLLNLPIVPKLFP
jgi:hypothetical protein